MRHTGRCTCGAVHYEVDGPFAGITRANGLLELVEFPK